MESDDLYEEDEERTPRALNGCVVVLFLFSFLILGGFLYAIVPMMLMAEFPEYFDKDNAALTGGVAVLLVGLLIICGYLVDRKEKSKEEDDEPPPIPSCQQPQPVQDEPAVEKEPWKHEWIIRPAFGGGVTFFTILLGTLFNIEAKKIDPLELAIACIVLGGGVFIAMALNEYPFKSRQKDSESGPGELEEQLDLPLDREEQTEEEIEY